MSRGYVGKGFGSFWGGLFYGVIDLIKSVDKETPANSKWRKYVRYFSKFLAIGFFIAILVGLYLKGELATVDGRKELIPTFTISFIGYFVIRHLLYYAKVYLPLIILFGGFGFLVEGLN